MAGADAVLAVAAAVTAVAGAWELVFRTAKTARLHNELGREFIALEKQLVLAGESLPEPRLRELQAARLDIEAREPPALRVLDAMCHDELVTALGIKEGERANPSRLQRLFAPLFDVGAHRLRKHAAS